MTIASEAASSSPSDQHRYPPVASTSQTTRTRRPGPNTAAWGPATTTYIVHTETTSISDTRLQVSHEPSSSKQPLRPVYLRERVLSEHDEIVDSLIDAETARVCWTIRRPTRGWYLYLRSPALPPGTAISICAGKPDEHDPTASPLTFSVNTKVRMHALAHVKPRIDYGSSSPLSAERSDGAASSTHTERLHPGVAIEATEQSAGEARQDVALAATGRENRKTSSGGHARRRSGATGSGSHTLGSQHPAKRPSSAVTSSPMIPEIEDEDTSSTPPTHNPLSRLAIPSTTTSSASSPLSASGDRPYSPTQPSSSTFPTSPLAARTSTLLLTDAQGPQHTAAPQSWARWACSILPSPVRPSLSLDADKSFSLYWSDPPGELGGGSGIEVLRFEDQSGRWMWNSHTRGRLTLQTSAMQALGLEQAFWITAALAYIQFLEDKDAYDAARDA